MKKFNFKIFIISGVILCALAYACFLAVVNEIFSIRTSVIAYIANAIFQVLGFPIIQILSVFHIDVSNNTGLALFVINCLLWALLIERIFTYCKHWRKRRNDAV